MTALLFLLLTGCDREALCAEPGVICTYAGTGTAGLGKEAVDRRDSHLYLPQDVTIGPEGGVYVLDWNNHRIRVVGDDDLVRTVAGSGLLGDGPEGPAMNAAFNHPTTLVFDDAGRAVISAWHNSRIERIDLQAGTLEFLAGTGERGYNGPDVAAHDAILDLPSSVVVDDAGRILFSDQANQQIRVLHDGVVTDLAGVQREPGYSGDGGPASEAHMRASVGQAADPANKLALDGHLLYMADTGNHVLRVIDLDTGIIDRVAGSALCDDTGCYGVPGATPDGTPALEAEFWGPRDVAVGPDGALYVADTDNSCVRVVTPDGVVDTVAGICGERGDRGDYGPATEALLDRPYGVEVAPNGDLFIADTHNQVVRVVRSP